MPADGGGTTGREAEIEAVLSAHHADLRLACELLEAAAGVSTPTTMIVARNTAIKLHLANCKDGCANTRLN